MKIVSNKRVQTAILIAAIFALFQVLITLKVIQPVYQVMLTMICINIIAAVSLNLVTGFTGQFSLGHAGFMSIGAYACAIITVQYTSLGGLLLGILAGALLSAVVGVLIGIPTLRLKGDYLAIATLGMAEIIRIIFLNLDITNGAAGLSVPMMTSWPLVFVFTAGSLILIQNFIRSSHGRACISIREDEIASESMGINTTQYKVMAFAIGAFFAGVAGALHASTFYFIKPDTFNFLKSIEILVIVVAGGMGSLTGSVIAAISLAIVMTFLQKLITIRMIIYAVLLVVIMIFRPQGIMGTKELSITRLFEKKTAADSDFPKSRKFFGKR